MEATLYCSFVSAVVVLFLLGLPTSRFTYGHVGPTATLLFAATTYPPCDRSSLTRRRAEGGVSTREYPNGFYTATVRENDTVDVDACGREVHVVPTKGLARGRVATVAQPVAHLTFDARDEMVDDFGSTTTYSGGRFTVTVNGTYLVSARLAADGCVGAWFEVFMFPYQVDVDADHCQHDRKRLVRGRGGSSPRLEVEWSGDARGLQREHSES